MRSQSDSERQCFGVVLMSVSGATLALLAMAGQLLGLDLASSGASLMSVVATIVGFNLVIRLGSRSARTRYCEWPIASLLLATMSVLVCIALPTLKSGSFGFDAFVTVVTVAVVAFLCALLREDIINRC